MDAPSDSLSSPSAECPSDDDDFTFIGFIDEEEQVSKTTAADTNTNRRRRDDRFGRFVAAKHNQRARASQNSDASKLIAHRFQRFAAAKRQQRAGSLRTIAEACPHGAQLDPSQDGGNGEEEPEVESPPRERRVARYYNLEEYPVSIAELLTGKSDGQPASERKVEQGVTRCDSEGSPVSVAELLAPAVIARNERPAPMKQEQTQPASDIQLTRCNSDESPVSVFDLVLERNTKTNEQSALDMDLFPTKLSTKRLTKSLSWWDDEANKDKPCTLKTDVIMNQCDESTWCDESTCDMQDAGCVGACVDNLDDIIEEQLEASYLAPLDGKCKGTTCSYSACVEDGDDNDSLYRNVPLDEQTFGKVLNHYSEKLGKPFSCLSEGDRDRMASLFRDLSSSFVPEDTWTTTSTLQVCKMPCFGK
ncbi:hypothetical protein ACHAXT_001020 [Thalassiosira profunda]